MGFPAGASGKEPSCQLRRCKRCGLDPWIKIPWRRAWKPTPVFLPGESQGQKSLAAYSPWGHKELDAAEETALHTYSATPLSSIPTWESSQVIASVKTCSESSTWADQVIQEHAQCQTKSSLSEQGKMLLNCIQSKSKVKIRLEVTGLTCCR